MNNKIHDGEDGLEGDNDTIFPVALMRQEERARQRRMKIFLNGVGVAELVLGVLVMILNVIFIYDGMNSGWYHSPEEEGSQLKVVSIGEGIIAGDLVFQNVSLFIFLYQDFSTSFSQLLSSECWPSLAVRKLSCLSTSSTSS